MALLDPATSDGACARRLDQALGMTLTVSEPADINLVFADDLPLECIDVVIRVEKPITPEKIAHQLQGILRELHSHTTAQQPSRTHTTTTTTTTGSDGDDINNIATTAASSYKTPCLIQKKEKKKKKKEKSTTNNSEQLLVDLDVAELEQPQAAAILPSSVSSVSSINMINSPRAPSPVFPFGQQPPPAATATSTSSLSPSSPPLPSVTTF